MKPDLHIPHTMERVKEADSILESARKRVEERKNVIGLDNYQMAMGWLTCTGDLRIGLDDNSIFGHLRKAQVYLEKAQETQKDVERLIVGLYGGPKLF
ncbi:hypothetical protein BGW80DRAFT_1462528 [Lactifluus volemus]|nr:hypothetical protein BGW80DRAFT_1462528 [Lactifluus volemus]